MQVRMFGTPSTFIRQFGQCPAQHSKPRGRWYLKLRVKIRRPERYSADATLSPGCIGIGLPLKRISTLLYSGRQVASTVFVRVSRSA